MKIPNVDKEIEERERIISSSRLDGKTENIRLKNNQHCH
jgi:hypothetical protein